MKTNWEKLKKIPRKKNIATPDLLWSLACDYMKDVDSNPFLISEQKKGNTQIPKGLTTAQIKLMVSANVLEIPRQRPYTWMGFSAYLALNGYLQRVDDYRANKDGRYDDYAYVISIIDNTFKRQKFEGAACGAFNANIISADLGLIAKSQQTVIQEQPLFPDAE